LCLRREENSGRDQREIKPDDIISLRVHCAVSFIKYNEFIGAVLLRQQFSVIKNLYSLAPLKDNIYSETE